MMKEHEIFKTGQMLTQQTKLIDFLQEKYETPMRKKKVVPSTIISCH